MLKKYAGAVAHREKVIKRLHANPPTDWTPAYFKLNINIVEQQIVNFKALRS